MSKSKAGRLGRLPAVLALILVAGIALFLVVAAYRDPPSSVGVATPPGVKLLEPAADSAPARVDYRRLDARIAALMQDPDMVGLAVGTVERGRVRFVKGYGETVAGSGVPITPDTVFRWASLSKSVAAALVAGLADEGKLSLDASVASLHTTLTLPGDTRNVTVADVLSHRLGLVRNAWDDRLEAGEDPKKLRSELGTLAPFCPPATCYAYQNIAFDTASEIVEGATGQGYASVARARLFGPLGMTHASVGRAGLQGAAR